MDPNPLLQGGSLMLQGSNPILQGNNLKIQGTVPNLQSPTNWIPPITTGPVLQSSDLSVGNLDNNFLGINQAYNPYAEPDNINYFISDGSQVNPNTGEKYAPNTPVLEAPDYVVNNKLFQDKVKSLAEQPVQVDQNGNLSHPFLTDEFKQGIEQITQYTKAIQDVKQQVADKLDPTAAEAYATSLVNAKVNLLVDIPGGTPQTADSIAIKFNQMNTLDKDSYLGRVKKVIESGDPQTKGEAAAIMSILQEKGNVNAPLWFKGLGLLSGIGKGLDDSLVGRSVAAVEGLNDEDFNIDTNLNGLGGFEAVGQIIGDLGGITGDVIVGNGIGGSISTLLKLPQALQAGLDILAASRLVVDAPQTIPYLVKLSENAPAIAKTLSQSFVVGNEFALNDQIDKGEIDIPAYIRQVALNGALDVGFMGLDSGVKAGLRANAIHASDKLAERIGTDVVSHLNDATDQFDIIGERTAGAIDNVEKIGDAKSTYKVIDQTKIGGGLDDIISGTKAIAENTKAKLKGIFNYMFRGVSADDSLQYTRLIEQGKTEEARVLLKDAITRGGDPQVILKGVLEFLQNNGVKIEEINNYLARNSYYKDVEKTVSNPKTASNFAKQSASQEKRRVFKDVPEILEEVGKIQDIGLMNNLIDYSFEALDSISNKKIGEALAASGDLVYAPVRSTAQDLEADVKGGKVTRYKSSAESLLQNGYREITDTRALDAIGAKANSYGQRTRVFATPENAQKIERIFAARPDTNTTRVLDSVANFTRRVQDLKTSGGIPFTPVNSLGAFQAIANTLANPKSLLRLPKNFIDSLSEAGFAKALDEMQPAVDALGRQGIRVGVKYGDRAVAATVDDAYNIIEKGIGKVERLGQIEDKMINPTFRFLELMQVSTFNDLYSKYLTKFDPQKAEQLAAQAYKNFYGVKTIAEKASGRLAGVVDPKTMEDLVTIGISAPRYKAINIDRVVNTLKSIPSTFSKEGRAAYRLNQQWALSTLLILGGIETANKAINGHYTWENVTGPIDELQIPIGGGNKLGFSLTGSTTAVPRSIGRALVGAFNGDTGTVLDNLLQNTSYAASPLLRDILNVGLGGSPITTQGGWGGIVDRLQDLATQYPDHPYIRAIQDLGNNKALSGILNGLESPVKVRNLNKSAEIDFSNSVVPDVQELIDNAQKQSYGAKDDAGREAIFEQLIKDVKSRVDASGRKYGYSSGDLTERMSAKLLGLLVMKSAVPVQSGTLDSSTRGQEISNEQTNARQVGAAQGLDLYDQGAYFEDVSNSAFGAPKRLAYDFDQATKANKDTGVPSLYDQEQTYYNALDKLYDQAKGLKGAAAQGIYSQINALQEEYMTQVFDARIKPLIDKYGPTVLNNNKVIEELASYIMVPSDYTPFASKTKQPYLTDDVKAYIRDRYGVGKLNANNIATDKEVMDSISKANQAIQSGNPSRANFLLSDLQQDINTGKSYADASTMEYIKQLVGLANKK